MKEVLKFSLCLGIVSTPVICFIFWPYQTLVILGVSFLIYLALWLYSYLRFSVDSQFQDLYNFFRINV